VLHAITRETAHIQADASCLQADDQYFRLVIHISLLEACNGLVPPSNIHRAVKPVPSDLLSVESELDKVEECRELREDDGTEGGIAQPKGSYVNSLADGKGNVEM
jgi:hypothetical protein